MVSITHWGRVTHICVGKLTTIGSDNGLSPGRRQANIWTNAGILLIWPLGTNFNEILIGIQTFSFKKMHLNCRLRNGVHFVPAPMWLTSRMLGNFIYVTQHDLWRSIIDRVCLKSLSVFSILLFNHKWKCLYRQSYMCFPVTIWIVYPDATFENETLGKIHSVYFLITRNHLVYGLSQCETILQGNAVSHCLSSYLEWSLITIGWVEHRDHLRTKCT